jgi:hypothetical protein
MEAEREICVLGDTNGNLAMVGHSLQTLGIIDAHHRWIGSSARLVLMGDVHADRFPWGLAITDLIANLNRQAKAAGGNIVRLAGNHDFDEAAILLSSGFVARENMGFAEILRYLSDPPPLPDQMFDPSLKWSAQEEEYVLNLINTHLKNPEQRAALRDLYRKNRWAHALAEAPLIHTETWRGQRILFTHVPPKEQMLAGTILNQEACTDAHDWMSYVNSLWKTRVHGAFANPPEESFEGLESLAHHYLDPGVTQVDWGPRRGQDLASVCVHFAVHGHITPAVRRQTIGPVEIFAVGSTSGISRSDPMGAEDGLSIMIFGKDGKIHFGQSEVRAYRSTHSA